jgi:hypothetical protein
MNRVYHKKNSRIELDALAHSFTSGNNSNVFPLASCLCAG